MSVRLSGRDGILSFLTPKKPLKPAKEEKRKREPYKIRKCQYVVLPIFLHIICYGYNVGGPDSGRSNRNFVQYGIMMLLSLSY